MTNGGLGVAFFAPFDDARYFLPWRPIPVSPISASRFFGERGLAIMRAEVLLIWLPAAILPLVTLGWRRRGRRV
jgi:inner membrane protein